MGPSERSLAAKVVRYRTAGSALGLTRIKVFKISYGVQDCKIQEAQCRAIPEVRSMINQQRVGGLQNQFEVMSMRLFCGMD